MITPLVALFVQYRDNDSSVSGRTPVVSLISLLPLIYVVFAAGEPDKAPLCYIDDYANPPRFAPDVVFRAGSFSRHARHLSLSCISRMRVVCPVAASRHPCGAERASRPLRCRAHIVVGADERLRGQFRSKRTCRDRRRVLILIMQSERLRAPKSACENIFFERFSSSSIRKSVVREPRYLSSPLQSPPRRGLGLLHVLHLWLCNVFPEANAAATG